MSIRLRLTLLYSAILTLTLLIFGVALYSIPLMIGASLYWISRTGFFFASAGAEMPIFWTIGLIVFAGLGDGPHALVRSPPLPLIGQPKSA